MARLDYRIHRNGPNMSGGKQDPKVALVITGIMFFVGLCVIFPLFPLVGIVWMIISGIALKKVWDELQKKGKKDQKPARTPTVPGKKGSDRNMKEFMQRMERTIMARDMEEKEFHSHTPMSYSYDKCARDKRMEQVETLYKAGLYTEEEYRRKKREAAE